MDDGCCNNPNNPNLKVDEKFQQRCKEENEKEAQMNSVWFLCNWCHQVYEKIEDVIKCYDKDSKCIKEMMHIKFQIVPVQKFASYYDNRFFCHCCRKAYVILGDAINCCWSGSNVTNYFKAFVDKPKVSAYHQCTAYEYYSN